MWSSRRLGFVCVLALWMVLGAGRASGALVLQIQQGDGEVSTTEPIDGCALGTGPVGFYDYRSGSSHTGLEQAHESVVFFYMCENTLSLFSIQHKHEVSGSGSLRQIIAGLPEGWEQLVYDDPSEGESGGDRYRTEGPYTLIADWVWSNHSDGLVVRLGDAEGLIGHAFTIRGVEWAGIERWRVLNGDGTTATLLDKGSTVTFTVIPEPATLVLLGIGGLGLRRRRV